MNPYQLNIVIISAIVLVILGFLTLALELPFGYGHFFVILAGGYAIYLNVKASKQHKERSKVVQIKKPK